MKKGLTVLATLAALLAIPSAALAQGYTLNMNHWTTRQFKAALPALPAPAVRIAHASCPGFATPTSCAYPDTGVVYLAAVDARDTFTINHELGHVFDFELLNAAERRALMPLLNHRATQWACSVPSTDPRYGADGCPLERFADAYAMCRMRNDPRQVWIWTAYGFVPNRHRLYQTCWMISAFSDADRNSPTQ